MTALNTRLAYGSNGGRLTSQFDEQPKVPRTSNKEKSMSLRQVISASLILCSLIFVGSCSKESSPAASPGAATQQHGSETAVPGSYEDWCGEHQVAESKCTRCDPSLVAAFKATGDWCAEHGLPESQCLKCNPELKIVRPPKPGGQ